MSDFNIIKASELMRITFGNESGIQVINRDCAKYMRLSAFKQGGIHQTEFAIDLNSPIYLGEMFFNAIIKLQRVINNY